METKFILLHPEDNVLICCQRAAAGEQVEIDNNSLCLRDDIELGHKIARYAVDIGDKIIKYGVSIGSAITDINAADHVHMHNMKSDYIPSHTRQSPQSATGQAGPP